MAEFAALLALVLLNAQMCAEAIKHLNYEGHDLERDKSYCADKPPNRTL